MAALWWVNVVCTQGGALGITDPIPSRGLLQLWPPSAGVGGLGGSQGLEGVMEVCEGCCPPGWVADVRSDPCASPWPWAGATPVAFGSAGNRTIVAPLYSALIPLLVSFPGENGSVWCLWIIHFEGSFCFFKTFQFAYFSLCFPWENIPLPMRHFLCLVYTGFH